MAARLYTTRLALVLTLGLVLSLLQISCRSSEDKWSSLYSEARLQLNRGDLSSAQNKAEEGLRDSENKNQVWNWKFRVLAAEVQLWQTHNDEVLHLLAIPPPPQLSQGEFAVRAKAAEAMALIYLSDKADDQGLLKEAEQMAARWAPELQCEVLLFEANQALKKGQKSEKDQSAKKSYYGVAEKIYRQSLQLAREHHQPIVEEGALISLGILTTRLGRFDESIEWSSTSLTFARSQQNVLAANVSISNLGWNYAELGDFEKAVSKFNELRVDSLGQEQLKHDVFDNLGQTYFAEGNLPAAHTAYLKAVDIATEMQRKKNTDEKHRLVWDLSNVAIVALEEGDLTQAEKYSLRASGLDPDVPGALLVSGRIAASQGRFPEAKAALQKLVDRIDPDSDDRLVRWDAQSELAKIAALEHQNSDAEREFKNLIKEVETARSSLRVDENRLAFSSHAGRYYDDCLRFLVGSKQKRKAFQVAEFSRARTMEEGVGIKAPAHPTDISIERLQGFLRQHNEVILAYWLALDKSFVWIVSPSQFELFPIAAQHEIEQQVDEYNKLLQDVENPGDLEQKGQSLYKTLISPAEKLIPAKARLVIIPDGGLSKLNFETLRVPHPAPHYWIEDVETEIASSTTLLINPRKREIAQKKLLLVGNPVEASKEYPALTHAGEELKRVEAHFLHDQETVVSGTTAVPSFYRTSHPERFDMIHFVTHGTAHELSPLESAIILSAQPDGVFKLYARDIVDIPIKADLVTISACYGLGKRAYSGEGLVGLAWAFLRAGAHQVVAGLWDVDDRASVDLMDDFYNELPKARSAATALRAAKLKMVHATSVYRLPYYWASLQLYVGS